MNRRPLRPCPGSKAAPNRNAGIAVRHHRLQVFAVGAAPQNRLTHFIEGEPPNPVPLERPHQAFGDRGPAACPGRLRPGSRDATPILSFKRPLHPSPIAVTHPACLRQQAVRQPRRNRCSGPPFPDAIPRKLGRAPGHSVPAHLTHPAMNGTTASCLSHRTVHRPLYGYGARQAKATLDPAQSAGLRCGNPDKSGKPHAATGRAASSFGSREASSCPGLRPPRRPCDTHQPLAAE